MLVEHSVTFVTNFNEDTAPSSSLSRIRELSPTALEELCNSAVREVIASRVLKIVNEGNTWATVGLKEG